MPGSSAPEHSTFWTSPNHLQKGQWLGEVELLATDRRHVLLYNALLAPLGALSFVRRPVRAARLARPGAAMLGCGRRCDCLAGHQLCALMLCVELQASQLCAWPPLSDVQAGAPAAPAQPQPRMLLGLLSTLLIKCPLRCGVLCLEPAVGAGAADWLHHRQLAPAEREALAAAAARCRGGAGPQSLGPDDDVHLLHHSLLRLGVLERLTVLGGSLAGLLATPLVRQVRPRPAPRSRQCRAAGPGPAGPHPAPANRRAAVV